MSDLDANLKAIQQVVRMLAAEDRAGVRVSPGLTSLALAKQEALLLLVRCGVKSLEGTSLSLRLEVTAQEAEQLFRVLRASRASSAGFRLTDRS